ncbi:MAG: iron uptake system protein EfeO [Ilumatobacteraceae bacterium]
MCGVAVLAAALTACGSDATKSAAAQTLSFDISDAGCSPATASGDAGEISFSVKNSTDSRAEFEIVTPAPQIALEKFLEAGKSDTYKLTLPAAEYVLICGSPLSTKGKLTLTGAGGTGASVTGSTVDPTALARAVTDYTAYINGEVAKLQTGVTAFTDAVRAGDTDQAKALYAGARVPWESIEPVAELFPDSDAVIDSRADDFDKAEADPDFSGFHAIEYGLWAQGTSNGATVDLPALADRLDSDIAALITSVKGITIQPQTMTGGAGALIEEAAQTKITGEEDRYSHTDVTTLAANVDGSEEIFNLLEPLLTNANAQLTTDLTASFAKVRGVLAPYKNADGSYQTYDKVSDADKAALKTAMAQLSEELSQITGSLGLVSAS